MGGYHRFLVHFPVALLVASFLFDLWARGTGREEARHASRYALVLGLVGALAALVTGAAAGDRLAARLSGGQEPMAGQLLWLLDTHRILAVTSLAAFALLLAWRLRRGEEITGRPASLYMVIAALATGLILTTGLYGGKIAHRDRAARSPGTESPAPPPTAP